MIRVREKGFAFCFDAEISTGQLRIKAAPALIRNWLYYFESIYDCDKHESG